ncbi:MAG: tyrosine-type recombinase/integrase [Bacteroidaceae bacterium]|nr:tyrosine-type recombinase/integrase [Bacteroidaceae bacterium]
MRKGHVYKTIVADLLTGQVVYVGDGKGADALKRFWKKVRKAKTAIKTVASTPYDDNPDVYRAGMFSTYTGLRRSDILALRWENIHHDRGRKAYIRFRIKKTGTLIQLPLSLPAIRVLGEPKSEGKIFPMITESILTIHIPRWLRKARIRKHITFHCFRHTFAMQLLDKGVDIYTIAALLGHRQVSSTQNYAKMSSKKMVEAIIKME